MLSGLSAEWPAFYLMLLAWFLPAIRGRHRLAASGSPHRAVLLSEKERVVSAPDIIANESICDAALVLEARAGNHHAFDELCRRYSGRLLSSIRRVLQNRWDAEDVLQDTLLSAFTHLNSFQGRSSFSTWMTKIAINAALSRLSRSKATVSIDEAREETGLTLSSVLQDSAPDAERRLIQAQQEELMATAIAQLPSSLRPALELRIRDGYSGKQIAEKMGISESAVKARLSRAYFLLREGQYTRARALPRPEEPRYRLFPI
jgi:RNA polymerase sigma-70 factor, ECF subfamily